MPANQDKDKERWVPVPDPTLLTTEALHREINSLRDLLETKLGALSDWVDKRFDWIEKNRTEQKQDLVASRLEQKQDSQDALRAALQAQKESVVEQNKSNAAAADKSEKAFTKQIDAIGELIRTTAKSTDDKVDDLKTRFTGTEGRHKGIGDSWGYLVGFIGIVAAIVAIIGLVVSLMGKHGG